MKRHTTRRDFLKKTTFAGMGFWVAARSAHTESKSANEKINIAVIGAGGKGLSDMQSVASENIVALCDVDENQAAQARKEQPKAKFYFDYRELLEKEAKNIDAVVVATPDHVHAPASIMAMKLGKHVYCQKPLTHSVYEARMMREMAAKCKVATQMGNQGTAENGLRRAVEVIRDGVIGPVRQVHVWSNRPIWPQGMERPEGSKAIPAPLRWHLWLGPAPYRPYNDGYHPFSWRGWQDFGTGALGDMACHTANMPFMALKLEYPTSVEAEHTGINAETYPKASSIRFEFPARGDMPALTFFWYDGGRKPPKDVTEDMKVPGSGCLLVGDKGRLFSPDDYGATFQLMPEDQYEGYKGPAQTIPRSPGHYKEWLLAIRGGPPAMSSFDYAARLTEMILLGNVAMRVGKKIEWDPANMKAPNCPEADACLKREYAYGYGL